MSPLPAFKEPDPLDPASVLSAVLGVLLSDDESAEAFGLDQIEWINGAFAAMAEFRKESAIAIFFPGGASATTARDAIWAKFIRMAEDSEWPAT